MGGPGQTHDRRDEDLVPVTVHRTTRQHVNARVRAGRYDVTAELNAAGELIGIEILNAKEYLRDSILDTVQARLLQLQKAG